MTYLVEQDNPPPPFMSSLFVYETGAYSRELVGKGLVVPDGGGQSLVLFTRDVSRVICVFLTQSKDGAAEALQQTKEVANLEGICT